MIDRNEINSKADEFEIHSSDVQRDYVFGWILAGIYGESPLRQQLVLKGGNCFRKAYFATTRFSSDLDFSTTNRIDPAALLVELNRVCQFVQTATGIQFLNDRNKAELKRGVDRELQVYEAKLYFKDFYGNPDRITISVRLDVTQFDRIYLPVQERNLIHPYSDGADCRGVIKCHKLEELLATKLKCLLQRRHTADLYDYVYAIFINKDLEIDRGEVLSTFLRKTIFRRSPGAAKGLLLDLPLEALRRAWARYIVCPAASNIDFDSALRVFRDGMEALFGTAVPGRRGERAFFPASIRNPIMDAGMNLTLLRLDYGGYRRMVEPYSLAFKRRKDGAAREYFYAWDRTGGRSGRPGIKAFLHTKISHIENTEEKFEPRFHVELSKAGEPPARSYFGSPFSGSAGRSRRVSTRPRNVFIVECHYCSRQFKRVRRNTALRKHKDQYGNDCYGRRGTTR